MFINLVLQFLDIWLCYDTPPDVAVVPWPAIAALHLGQTCTRRHYSSW